LSRSISSASLNHFCISKKQPRSMIRYCPVRENRFRGGGALKKRGDILLHV
jgi:hypothetical protein